GLAAGEAEAHESSGQLLDPVDTESDVVAGIVAGGGAAEQHEPGVAGAPRVRIAPIAPVAGSLDQQLVEAVGLDQLHSLWRSGVHRVAAQARLDLGLINQPEQEPRRLGAESEYRADTGQRRIHLRR